MWSSKIGKISEKFRKMDKYGQMDKSREKAAALQKHCTTERDIGPGELSRSLDIFQQICLIRILKNPCWSCNVRRGLSQTQYAVPLRDFSEEVIKIQKRTYNGLGWMENEKGLNRARRRRSYIKKARFIPAKMFRKDTLMVNNTERICSFFKILQQR